MSTEQLALAGSAEPRRYNWLARTSVVFTFVLICAGALVTGNEARLADPEWPSFFGKSLPTSETFVGGARYEDTHRIIASIAGLLTLLLAFWIQRGEPRRSVRKLAWWAVAAVFLQALAGGLIIHVGKGTFNLNPELTSTIHASLGHSYFMLCVALAVVSSAKWFETKPELDRPGNVSYRGTLRVVVVITYIQLLLGASVRHSTTAFLWHLVAHIIVALALAMYLLWITMRTFGEYSDVSLLRKRAITLLALLATQVLLGAVSIFANRDRANEGVSSLPLVIVSTAHVVVGTLILAYVLSMAMHAFRLLSVPESRAAIPDAAGQVA